MKRILLVAVLIGAMLSVTAYVACIAFPLLGNNLKGSGEIVTRTLPAPDFHGIDASRAVKVIVTNEVSDIRIEADDNLIDRVVVEERKGVLVATIDKSVTGFSHASVTITVPDNGKIRSLDASSASSIRCDVPLKADKCTIEASSAAKIEASVEAGSCDIDASSASKIKAAVTAASCSVHASSASKIALTGSAESFQADLSSASKLNGSKFTAVDARIETSSASGASIDCTGSLTASASSGSSIRYTGDCRTSLSQSSGGSIRKN